MVGNGPSHAAALVTTRNCGLGTPIYAAFQGKNGKVWFGLEEGLMVYDGKGWTCHLGMPAALRLDANTNLFFQFGIRRQ